MEEVEFWTFNCVDGNIRIYFDKQQKYIDVTPKDLRSMVSWIIMDKGTYYPNWDKGLFD